MSPRVSEAARIFAVAAFLVLIAQGPTFSGHASQLAAANCAKNGAIVQCDEQKVDKKVEVEKGAPTVETKSGGDATKDPCSKENKASNYDAYKKAGCESKGEGKTTFKDENGNEKQVCTTCGGGGAVSEGSGGTSNPSAVDQYTSGDNRPAISQVPVLASPTTADAMNRAFPGVADGTVKLAYPVTPSGQEASNTDGSSSPAPVSSVPGTALDNSQPVNLNQGTMQNIAALTPPQVRADMPGASSYISPSNGATLGTNGVSVVSAPDSLWKANQELGGVQSPVSPSQVFFAQSVHQDASVTNPQPEQGFISRAADAALTQLNNLGDGVRNAIAGINNFIFTPAAAEPSGFADVQGVKLSLDAGVVAASTVESVRVYGLDNELVGTIPITTGQNVETLAAIISKNPEDFLLTQKGESYGGYIEMVTAQGRAVYDPAVQGSDIAVNGGTGFSKDVTAETSPAPGSAEVAPIPKKDEVAGVTNVSAADSEKPAKSDQGKPANDVADVTPAKSPTAGENDQTARKGISLSNVTRDVTPGENSDAPASETRGGVQGGGQDGQAQTTQGQSAGSMVQGSGQGSATQSAGTSGGGTGVASANKTTPASGQGTAPSQSQPAQETKAAQQKCDDVNANPSKYGAADIESCKSGIERVLQGAVKTASNAIGSLLGISSASAEPAARTPSIADVFPAGPIRTAASGSKIPSYTPDQIQQLAGRVFTTVASNFSDTTGTKDRLLDQNQIFFSSPDIPENTNLRVTVTNKQGVTTILEGKVLDFGPDTGQVKLSNRKIDLSQGACRASDSCTQGLAQAKVEILPSNAAVPDRGQVVSGGSGASTPQKSSGFSISVAATAPGVTPTSGRAQVTVSPQGVSLCIGNTGCTIDEKSYINSLCQPDTGCSAKQLGAQSDPAFKERVMTNPTERAADYARQIALVGANVTGSRPVLIDNCQHSGTCTELMEAIRNWNAAHPNAQIQPMINNPVLVGEKLGKEAAVDLLNRAAAAGGGGIWEPGGGSVAENAALRDASKFPSMPLLAVGTAPQMQIVGKIIGTLGFKNIGTSISSQTEGGNGYRDGTAGKPLTLGVGEGSTEAALKKFSESQTPFVFGRTGTDGKVELLDPKSAAAAAKNGEKLDVYESTKPTFPFNPSNYVKSGDTYYKYAGGADEYRTAKTVQAQAAIENAARGQQIGAKLGTGVVIEGAGVSRPVYTAQSDGSRGDRVGTLTVLSKEQAQIAAAAQKLGLDALPCAQGMCSPDGKVLSLRAAQGSMQAAKTVVPTNLGGKVVKLDGVPLQRMTHEQYVEAFRSAGVTVVDQSQKVFTPTWLQSPSANSRFIFHGDVAPGNRLIPYEAQQLSMGRAAAQGVLREDGTLVILKRLDTVSYHAPSSNYAGPGIETAGADNGRNATSAQFEAQQKMAGALLERGMEVGTHGQAEPSRRNTLEAGQSIVSYLYSGSSILAPRVALFATGEDGTSGQIGEAIPSSVIAGAQETAVYQGIDKNGAPNGAPIALDPIGDLGKAEVKLAVDTEGNLGLTYEYTAPPKPDIDTRSPIEKIRDAAADAQTKMRDMWKNMFGGGQQPAGGQQGGGGAQPANNAVPANNSRPAGGAAQPSNSGTPAPAPARTGQQPATTANGASGSQTPVVSVSGGNTATGISGERFTCSPGTVVNGSTATPLTIAWTCPAGTTSIGTGFSTLGTNSGSVQLVVSTTSASVNYQLTCQGAQASQTLSCAVQVRHPRVTLVAKPASVESGAPVQLQWSAFDVTSCSLYAPPTVLLVSGGTQGTANTLPLSRSSVFSALCNVGSATTTASVTVLVKGDTAAPLQTVLPR